MGSNVSSGSKFYINQQQSPPIEDNDPKISLMGLPDDMFLEIVSYLDFSNRLKLRVSKEMEARLRSIKNELNAIYIEITASKHYHLRLIASDKDNWRRRSLTSYSDLSVLERAMRSWALKTHVGRIEIDVKHRSDAKINSVVDAFFQFNADQLIVKEGLACNFPQLELSTLLMMTSNMKKVSIGLVCTCLAAADLCIFLDMMAQASYLEWFSVIVTAGIAAEFVQEFTGATRNFRDQNTNFPVVEYRRPTHESRPVKMYMSRLCMRELICFKDDIKIEVSENRISFEKMAIEQKDELIKKLHKIKLNHPYKT